MIVVDLCKVNYQTLRITYQKLIIKISKKVWKEKKIRSECEFVGFKDNRLNYKCKECNDTSARLVDDLIEKFPRTYKFCNGDHNKFVLLLRKGVYAYEYMDSWERFNETSLPHKKAFYSDLNLEDLSDKDYFHAQKVWKEFGIRNLGEYHELYVQTDTLLLSDVYEKFRDKCIEIYGLDPSYFLSAPGLAWQACLKKTKVKLELLTDANMLLPYYPWAFLAFESLGGSQSASPSITEERNMETQWNFADQ